MNILNDYIPVITTILTVLNGFILIKLNPIKNELSIMKEQWKDHDKRIGAIESATAISQTNNMKLAVIDERLKTYDVRMDRIERKIDGIAESQNSVGQQAQMNKLEIENIKLKIEKRS